MRDGFVADKINNAYRLGLTQSFEIICELGWKVLKDYLYTQGIVANTPNEVIKEAFSKEVISNGQTWIDMVKARNATSHEYNMDKIDVILENISSTYYDELTSFKEWLRSFDGK